MPYALKHTAAALLLTTLVLTSCAAEPRGPDLATRDDFAQSVMSAAASGSVDEVEKLVMDDRVNVRPQAEKLVQFSQGWSRESGTITISNEFPEVADVEVSKTGQTAKGSFKITWSKEHWALLMGDPAHPPSGGASGGLAPTPEPTKNITGSAKP